MSNEKNDGGYAFPKGGGNSSYGMSLRDYFAAKAMQGSLAHDAYSLTWEEHAGIAYSVADAMLKAREE